MNDLARFASVLAEELRPAYPTTGNWLDGCQLRHALKRTADRLQQSPEEGWRRLESGEARKQGDEWFDGNSGEWRPVGWGQIGVIFCDHDAPVRRFEKPEDPRLTSLLSALERISIAASMGLDGSSIDRLQSLVLIHDTANKALAEQTTSKL